MVYLKNGNFLAMAFSANKAYVLLNLAANPLF